MYKDDLMIGICDDEPWIRKKIREICEHIQEVERIKVSLAEFANGDEVLSFGRKIDLLILDIEMPGSNGFVVRELLQVRKEDAMIIYVTDHDEWMGDSFGINVYGFVPKRLLECKLEWILKSALQRLSRPSVELADGIDSSTVVYVKAETPYCRIYFRDRHDEMLRVGIDSLAEKLLSVDFIRVHRSYLVNLKWMEQVTEQGVAAFGSVVPVSRRLKSQVKKAFMDYARKYAGFC